MAEIIMLFVIGILFLFIGVSNRKGNIQLLHSYHRKRVKEEDRIPLGKRVGLGIIIIGSVIIISGITMLFHQFTGNEIFLLIFYNLKCSFVEH